MDQIKWCLNQKKGIEIVESIEYFELTACVVSILSESSALISIAALFKSPSAHTGVLL
jgi:hypothetical protein